MTDTFKHKSGNSPELARAFRALRNMDRKDTCGASTAKQKGKANYSWNDTISELTATAKPPQPGAALPEEIAVLLEKMRRTATALCMAAGKGPFAKTITLLVEAACDCVTAQAEALAAKDADLNECRHELASLRDTLDNLVATVRERSEAAEARVKVLEGALRPLMAFLRDRVTDAPRAGYIQIVCTEDENDLISGILAALLSDAEAALRGEES